MSTSSFGSVTFWIAQLKAGRRQAVEELWRRYFERLTGVARRKLTRAAQQLADEEDVCLSAFDSFCRAAEAGRFPDLQDRDDLWWILVMLARRKAVNLVKHEQTDKRGGGRRQSLPEDGESAFNTIIFDEPDPGLAAQVAEQCQRLLAMLDDDQHREIALLKLEGYTNEEISANLGRSVATVERKLKRIRECWNDAR
jgi:RNA polymerase sigma factor (sigma-70 family)